MKANELSYKDLMVGDWVKIKTYGVSDMFERTEAYVYVKVAEIGSGLITVEYNNEIKEPYRICENTEIEPIPLTPEILEKNGFSADYRNDDLSYAQSCGDVIGIHINGENGIMDEMYFKYVHQLQQALRLCGIEKTIEL